MILVVVNEAKTCKDKADQGAISLKYCRPEDPGLRDLPVREPDCDWSRLWSSAGWPDVCRSGWYLPEGWLILGVPVQHRFEDRGCGLHLRNHRRRHRRGGRRRGRDQRHRKERWQRCHRSGHLRGLRQNRHRPRGHRHRKIKEYVLMDIYHEVSVIIDINGKD